MEIWKTLRVSHNSNSHPQAQPPFGQESEGYAEFAKYVRKHAKLEAIKKIENDYNKHYMEQYRAEEERKLRGGEDIERATSSSTASRSPFSAGEGETKSVDEIAERVAERMSTEEYKKLIDSEVTASLVGKALNSDKLLQRYAKRDEKLIKRVLTFLKRIFTELKSVGADKSSTDTVEGMIDRFNALLQMPESETGGVTGKKYSVIQKDGVYYTPTDEEIIKNHPTINGVIINDAEYAKDHTLPDDEYKAYQKKQVQKANKISGTYTNKDTAYSDRYGLINAEFGNKAIKKGRFYGGIALYDILPYVPQIFENAVVLNTKPDSKSDTNIKGIVNLVGCAILNNKYVAVVKLNVKEYANNEAKIYDNRVIEIEELTVVERVGHQEVKTSSDSTSSAVSSEYIIAKFRDFVNTSDKKTSPDAEYMSAVERGDMETAQRMVDEAAKKAGYHRLFYHGAKKGGGFTVFRDWSYFTENKAYAERYSDREKSGSLYTVYVKLDKPFDTRKAADRKLFNQIRNEYGLSPIQDSGLPDWTDGYDISDYIDENDLDYNGIILDEGGDMVDGKPVSRGESYVVRKSAQIKSADPVTYDDNGNVIPLSERFNEKKSDIRYAIVDSELDEDGEVKNDYFEAAVKKALEEQRERSAIVSEERKARNKAAVESRKTKFEKVLADLVKLQRKIEKLKKSADEGDKLKLKEAQKTYNELLGDLGAIQIELRQMGYDMSAEQRLIERQKKQIEAQGASCRWCTY